MEYLESKKGEKGVFVQENRVILLRSQICHFYKRFGKVTEK